MTVQDKVMLVVGADFGNYSTSDVNDALKKVERTVLDVVAEHTGEEWYNLVANNNDSYDYKVFNVDKLTRVATVSIRHEHREGANERFTASVNMRDMGTIFEYDIHKELNSQLYEYIDEEYNTEKSYYYSNLFEFISGNFTLSEWEDLTLSKVESELALCEMTLQG